MTASGRPPAVRREQASGARLRKTGIANVAPGSFKSMIMLFSSRRPKSAREGLTYVSEGEQGPMRHAREGMVVRTVGRGPPWIVVADDFACIIPERWPGRLWRVRIVEAANEAEQRKRGGVPKASAGYTRAIAVEVVAQEDVGALFGEEGASVLRVIEAASRLNREDAELLARSREPEAAMAYDRTWRAWMKDRAVPGIYPDPLDGALLVGGSGSPINRGLTVLHQVIFERARRVDGEAAFTSDGEDQRLAAPWDGAAAALLDAALAFGAPEFLDGDDRDTLLRAWSVLFA